MANGLFRDRPVAVTVGKFHASVKLTRKVNEEDRLKERRAEIVKALEASGTSLEEINALFSDLV